MLNAIKKWIKEPPKHSLEYYLCWLLFLQVIFSKVFIGSTFITLGALQPNVDVELIRNQALETSQSSITSMTDAFMKLFQAGQNITKINSTTGWLIGHGLSYLMIAIIIGMITIGFSGILRLIVNSIYRVVNTHLSQAKAKKD